MYDSLTKKITQSGLEEGLQLILNGVCESLYCPILSLSYRIIYKKRDEGKAIENMGDIVKQVKSIRKARHANKVNRRLKRGQKCCNVVNFCRLRKREEWGVN